MNDNETTHQKRGQFFTTLERLLALPATGRRGSGEVITVLQVQAQNRGVIAVASAIPKFFLSRMSTFYVCFEGRSREMITLPGSLDTY
jgi:hypothetical protein